jgi:twitching motility protein PilT
MRTREYIEKGESDGKSLIDAMDQGDQDGMQTFDGVLEQLIRNGTVTKEGAMPYASNSNNLLLRISDMDMAPAPSKSTETKAVNEKEKDSILDMIER